MKNYFIFGTIVGLIASVCKVNVIVCVNASMISFVGGRRQECPIMYLKFELDFPLEVGYVPETPVPKVRMSFTRCHICPGPLLFSTGGYHEIVFHRRIVLDTFVLLWLNLKIKYWEFEII